MDDLSLSQDCSPGPKLEFTEQEYKKAAEILEWEQDCLVSFERRKRREMILKLNEEDAWGSFLNQS